MKNFLKNYIQTIKNHPEQKRYCVANAVMVFVWLFLLCMLFPVNAFMAKVACFFCALALVDSVVCSVVSFFTYRKEKKQEQKKETNDAVEETD